ncbi:MAG: 30S ribosomal protein S12 methylthiotransferase RimO [Xylanivirga thermophila]|uniref:30S ribosomal protein S12 methylthiotransferase RimO n=1 Tax=Xylanivirga thermophila TaxID=2496273 RepID=UPI00101CF4D6|nr:30S ribosomal protein S12 methylthiotransferase RimO [Xylanivirga thermophila]
MIRNIGMVSLGCPKNQVDAENMLALLSKAGYQIVNKSEEADAIIVNTCGFIGPAKEESIDAILEQAKYKTIGNCKALIVTGCLAQRYSKALYEEIPEIDAIIGTGHYQDIVNVISHCLTGERMVDISNIDCNIVQNLPRILTTPPHTAYLKIAEGCSNFCTYCIIPKLRGKYRSRSIDSIVDEAKLLVDNGVQELILIAQDVAAFGTDMKNGSLVELLNRLCDISNLKWLRLLYCYPDRIDDDLLDTIAIQPKICKYLDIPIQHINQDILKRMNRHVSSDKIKSLLDRIHQKIPDAIVRTSIIVGFPGETDEHFDELMQFIKQYPFNRMGVFCYSQEEGTPAARYENQVDNETKVNRQKLLMMEQRKISKKLNRKRVGQVVDVLIEGTDSPNVYFGRSYGEALGIDGQIFVMSNRELSRGDFVSVKISKAYDYDLLGDAL